MRVEDRALPGGIQARGWGGSLVRGHPEPPAGGVVQAERPLRRAVERHDLAALGVRPVAGAAALEAAAREVVGITVAEELFGYIWALADQTRRSPSLALGVSPRGAAMLLSVAKAWAYLSGRAFVTPDDVKALVKPAWRHRVVLRPEVEMEGATTDAVLDGVVERVPVPK